MSFAPLPSIRYTGMGLALGAGLISSATSWLRANSYVKTGNEEMFLPRGLRCRVLKTKKSSFGRCRSHDHTPLILA
jgi:hypothetical protein